MESKPSFFPREHGATAMLLTPFVSGAILARVFQWQEIAALIAIVSLFAMKEPLIVIARQRWVWRDRHPEVAAAVRWLTAEIVLMAVGGMALLWTGPALEYSILFAGAVLFSTITVWVHVHNRQRSTLFQVVSAMALTSTSLVAALSATGRIQSWTWALWGLLAAQATAGIFTVHARIDARVAAKNPAHPKLARRPARICAVALLLGSITAVWFAHYEVAAGLLLVASSYLWDLRRQGDPESLKMPLTKVGLRALAFSLVYAALMIAGLW